MESIIEVKNLGKKYNIGERHGYIALRDVLSNVAKSPLMWFGRKMKSVAESSVEDFWALSDINFTVEKGEIMGVIGRNGAGKSTLLKIISQITPPTIGEIKLKGRVGSLLEVGTGFHPELTGRENIFLNGAILGMRKKEIEDKFDQIVKFSGIEKFLDMPVKRYSSGMYVRLAFSVAAHLEPDILIIDEVLAVGDAEFQRKCIGKMEEVTRKEGRTVLFVSHNMGAIKKLCKRCILLDQGKVVTVGDTESVVEEYLGSGLNVQKVSIEKRKDRQGSGRLKVIDYFLKDNQGKDISFFTCGQNVQLWFECEINDNIVEDINFFVNIDSIDNQCRLFTVSNKFVGVNISLSRGKQFIKFNFPRIPLNVGQYRFTIFVEKSGEILDWVQGAGTFSVEYGDFYGSNNIPVQMHGSVLIDYSIL